MADTMTGLKRTNYCGEVTAALEGKEVVVCGWVQRIRDKGMLVFIDLRDRSGIVQLAFDDTTEEALRQKAQSARSEFVLMAKGVVRRRESINKDMPNGDVEVAVSDLRILAKAATPPFEITEKTNVKEELRLKYRYLDLRRKEMQENIMMRHRIVKEARDYYDHTGFIEIETPTLIKSTPEGARDYLVPSRVQPGHFYALPQSPQQYKQLLMLSGYDRYMQVARCYRDEDLRADRQPEFTQIDVEMSFVDEQDVMGVAEGFLQQAFKNVLNIDLTTPFPILKYKDAMEQYGSDKPDIRFDLKIHNLTDVLKNTEFKMFAEAIAAGGSVRGIVAKDAADKLTRKEIDKLGDFVKTYRAKGLAYTRFTTEGVTSSFEKFLSPEEIAAMHTALGASTGDVLFVIADVKDKVVFESLGALRNHLAQKLELTQPGTFAPLWVTEFPLFEYDEEENRYCAMHHPFTSPMLEDLEMMETDPAKCRARAYDIVLNGYELGGGSIRINDPEVQQRMFAALGLSPETVQERFGFLIDAFRYGAPPHGGMAFGLDRVVMLMLGKDNIKEVIAFPKVQNASELMTGAPGEVDQKNLDELFLKMDLKN
ncbi:MAG: aspartate--tRNA ligase [Angelakisella sp.]